MRFSIRGNFMQPHLVSSIFCCSMIFMWVMVISVQTIDDVEVHVTLKKNMPEIRQWNLHVVHTRDKKCYAVKGF